MDVLDKAAVQRKNDSMAKLTDFTSGSLTGFEMNANGIVSEQKYSNGVQGLKQLAKAIGLKSTDYLNTGFNIPGLPSWGDNKPDLKTIFMSHVSDLLTKMSNGSKNSSEPGTIVQQEFKDVVEKYSAFADKDYYKGSDSATCDIKRRQVVNAISEEKGKLLLEERMLYDNTHAAKDVLDKNAGEIGKAKTDSSTGSDRVFGDLASSANFNILGKSIDLGQLSGIGGLGNDSRKVIFNSANTGSVVAAEQQNTMVETLSFARDSLAMNLDIKLKSIRNRYDFLESIDYANRKLYEEAKAQATTKDFETKVESNINKKGAKYKSAWEDKYGNGLFGL